MGYSGEIWGIKTSFSDILTLTDGEGNAPSE